MNNLDAILKMDLKKMAIFLDQVYLTGLNKGMHAATLDGEDQEEYLQGSPYGEHWLLSEAEDATALVFADDGDTYLPEPLAEAIMEIAGISPEGIHSEGGSRDFKIKITLQASDDDTDLDDMSLPELKALLEKLEQQMAILQADEPEDEDSDEYEEWEDAIDELEDRISEVEDAISGFGDD